MKVSVSKSTIVTENIIEQDIKVYDLNTLIDIVQEKIYTDKLGAVVRETLCNCRDAHKESKQLRKIDIVLPSHLSDNLIFRDYGYGLSDESIQEIYFNIGFSTKNKNNKYIGGFGLGSKSIFSYAPHFTVCSYYNGKKSTFIIYKDSSKSSKFSKVAEENTKEPTGLEIIVEIKNEDRRELLSTLVRYCYYCKDEVNVINSSSYESDILRYDKRFCQELSKVDKYNIIDNRNRQYSDNKYQVIIGGVPYYFDINKIDSKCPFRGTVYFDLIAAVGSIDIPPARETVEYTPKTVTYLKKLLSEFTDELIKSSETFVNQCTSSIEARKLFNQGLNSTLNSVLRYVNNFVYKGKIYNTKLNTSDLESYKLKINKVGVLFIQKEYFYNFGTTNKFYVFYYSNDSKLSWSKIKSICKAEDCFILYKTTKTSEEIKQDQRFEGLKIYNLDDISLPKVVRKKKDLTEYRTTSKSNLTFDYRNMWIRTSLDPEKFYFYFKLENTNIVSSLTENYLYSYYSQLFDLVKKDECDTFVGVSLKEKIPTNCKSYDDALCDFLESMTRNQLETLCFSLKYNRSLHQIFKTFNSSNLKIKCSNLNKIFETYKSLNFTSADDFLVILCQKYLNNCTYRQKYTQVKSLIEEYMEVNIYNKWNVKNTFLPDYKTDSLVVMQALSNIKHQFQNTSVMQNVLDVITFDPILS